MSDDPESHPKLNSVAPPPLPPDSVYTSCYCEENIYLLAQHFRDQSALAQSVSRKADAAADATSPDSQWFWEIYVIFISNDGKTVALWKQKAKQDVVIWDYHVILVLLPTVRRTLDGREVGTWVYDFDSELAMPCNWIEYVYGTFPYSFDPEFDAELDDTYRSLFRVISVDEYLENFASDRSHMLLSASEPTTASESDADKHSHPQRQGTVPQYGQPPPAYPALRGLKARELGITHNLMSSFVTMSASGTRKYHPPKPEDGVGVPVAQQFGKVMDMDEFLLWISGEDAVRERASGPDTATR